MDENVIEQIREAFKKNSYGYSQHAVDQSILRHIASNEIVEAIEAGKIIEDYPEDKYGPSCLIFGRTVKGRPLHIQCSYPLRPKIKIVTLYEPASEEWIDYKVRRK